MVPMTSFCWGKRVLVSAGDPVVLLPSPSESSVLSPFLGETSCLGKDALSSVLVL